MKDGYWATVESCTAVSHGLSGGAIDEVGRSGKATRFEERECMAPPLNPWLTAVQDSTVAQ